MKNLHGKPHMAIYREHWLGLQGIFKITFEVRLGGMCGIAQGTTHDKLCKINIIIIFSFNLACDCWQYCRRLLTMLLLFSNFLLCLELSNAIKNFSPSHTINRYYLVYQDMQISIHKQSYEHFLCSLLHNAFPYIIKIS